MEMQHFFTIGTSNHSLHLSALLPLIPHYTLTKQMLLLQRYRPSCLGYHIKDRSKFTYRSVTHQYSIFEQHNLYSFIHFDHYSSNYSSRCYSQHLSEFLHYKILMMVRSKFKLHLQIHKLHLQAGTPHSPNYNSHYFLHIDHYNSKSQNLNTLRGYSYSEPLWYTVMELRNKIPQSRQVPFPQNPQKV